VLLEARREMHGIRRRLIRPPGLAGRAVADSADRRHHFVTPAGYKVRERRQARHGRPRPAEPTEAATAVTLRTPAAHRRYALHVACELARPLALLALVLVLASAVVRGGHDPFATLTARGEPPAARLVEAADR
jgi:hypothetical protein